MYLPAHITAKKISKTKENKKSERDKNKSNRPDDAERKSHGAEASAQPDTDKNKSDRKLPTSNTSNPGYPGNKKKNSDGYGYGYKKSANSTASKTQSAHTILTDELKKEDKLNTKEANRKQFGSTLFMFFAALAIIIVCNSMVVQINSKLKMKFTITSASATHYKIAILTDDLHVSALLMDIGMELGMGVDNEGFSHQRETAYLFALFVKLAFRKLNNQAPLLYSSNQTLGYFVSHLSWGFDQEANEMNPGPMIAYQDKIFGYEFENVMHFPKLRNSSLMSKSLNLSIMLHKKIVPWAFKLDTPAHLPGAKNLNMKTERHKLFFDTILPYISDNYGLNDVRSSNTTGNPTTPISNLPYYGTEKFGALQFASSGPKTLGSIAEIAIRAALEALVNHDSVSGVEYVDKVVAQALIHTLDAVALQNDYFEKLVLNKTDAIDRVREKLKDPENLEKHHRSSSIVQFETSGALTSNLMILDNSDGWPAVFHYSVSAPGPFFLRALDKNSTEMVNSCQIIVIKDGYLWLTAAASGEFYLLEKVVASIVHKIVRDADPLSAIVYRQRLRYDTRDRMLKTDKTERCQYLKESLQFSQYNVLIDRFRSWNQRSVSSVNATYRQWNIATGV